MSRCGRKKKNGLREPNGRLRRMEAAERRATMGERGVVLSQPQRRCAGERDALDQKLESPLGRFVIRHKLHGELYDSGVEYGTSHFYAAKGIAIDVHEGRGGSGHGVDPAKAKWLERDLDRLNKPLRELSPIGFSAMQLLAVHEREAPPGSETEAIGVLFGLARLLKKLGRQEA
jgi:hypothetical protein